MDFEHWYAARHGESTTIHAVPEATLHGKERIVHDDYSHDSRLGHDRVVHEDVYFDSDDEGLEKQRVVYDDKRSRTFDDDSKK